MEGGWGGSLRPVTPLLVPYGKQKITGYVHTLLSIDKGIDCVSGFVLSCIFEKDSVTGNKNLGGMWDKMQPIG